MHVFEYYAEGNAVLLLKRVDVAASERHWRNPAIIYHNTDAFRSTSVDYILGGSQHMTYIRMHPVDVFEKSPEEPYAVG